MSKCLDKEFVEIMVMLTLSSLLGQLIKKVTSD